MTYLAVVGNVLTVEGLDVIDGTPVLDIKPYVPEFDRAEGHPCPAGGRNLWRDTSERVTTRHAGSPTWRPAFAGCREVHDGQSNR